MSGLFVEGSRSPRARPRRPSRAGSPSLKLSLFSGPSRAGRAQKRCPARAGRGGRLAPVGEPEGVESVGPVQPERASGRAVVVGTGGPQRSLRPKRCIEGPLAAGGSLRRRRPSRPRPLSRRCVWTAGPGDSYGPGRPRPDLLRSAPLRPSPAPAPPPPPPCSPAPGLGFAPSFSAHWVH